MHENRLLMNETKTEFLLIGTKQQLAKVNVDHVKVGNADFVPHSPVKNLGVWLDWNLSMVEHFTKASSAAFFHLYNIRRIRKYISRENTETLIHAFVSCRIERFWARWRTGRTCIRRSVLSVAGIAII